MFLVSQRYLERHQLQGGREAFRRCGEVELSFCVEETQRYYLYDDNKSSINPMSFCIGILPLPVSGFQTINEKIGCFMQV